MKIEHQRKLKFNTLIGAIALTVSTNLFATPVTVVVQWDETTLQAIRDTHPGPPIVARMLAVVHTAMYDAWAAYDKRAIGTRLGNSLRRPSRERTEANKKVAVSYAAYRALVDLFPGEKAKFDAAMTSLGLDPGNASTDTATPAGIGNVAANAVIEYRHHDGANQLGDLNPGPYSDYTGYQPVNTPDQINDPAHWQPLRVSDGHGGTAVQKYITPHWGNVEPFALHAEDKEMFRWTSPAAYGTADFVKQAQEVIDYSANLTDRQKVIAEYWADGPSSELPPGHWAKFAQFISERDHHDLDNDVKMFFALTNAVFDASIVCWDVKRFHDYVRPVTAIHSLFAGQMISAWAGPNQGTQLIPGETWRPYQAATVVTPPFPEYFSGHSVFSRTAAEILKRYTGSSAFGYSTTIMAGSSKVEPGTVPANSVTLYWPTFKAAADEAGISRRYGGIHFEQGDLDARAAGPKIAKKVWKTVFAYFNGLEDSSDTTEAMNKRHADH
jgi:hypothetical protein